MPAERLATMLVSEVNDITYGDKAVFIITVNGPTSGTVTLSMNNKIYNGTIGATQAGKAIIIINDILPATYPYTVSFAGDATYSPASVSGTLQVVAPFIDPDDIKLVESGPNLVVIVPENICEGITVTAVFSQSGVQKANKQAVVNDGVATIDFSDLPTGTYDVTVTLPFYGTNYSQSSQVTLN